MEVLPDLGNERVQPLRNVRRRLAAGAAVLPDVPVARNALRCALRADFLGRDALVVTVVPLADGLRDLDARVAVAVGPRPLVLVDVAVLLPGQASGQAEVEELECALGSFARGNVAGRDGG